MFKSRAANGMANKKQQNINTMHKRILFSLAICVGAGASAQTVSDIHASRSHSAYMQDSRDVIVRSPFGLCWRSGTWTPADAVPGCDGALVPPVSNPIAPDIASTAPVTQTSPAAPQRCDFAITLGTDQAFAFNKAILSNAAQKKLDAQVISRLESCANVETILITGHADRLGSQQYNQRLSEKRANAVATYLKSKGVAHSISTRGAGKAEPVKDCHTRLDQKELIKCLAPNRRVTVEVRGTTK
jgi:OOP family OmpA-OmpF porin